MQLQDAVLHSTEHLFEADGGQIAHDNRKSCAGRHLDWSDRDMLRWVKRLAGHIEIAASAVPEDRPDDPEIVQDVQRLVRDGIAVVGTAKSSAT